MQTELRDDYRLALAFTPRAVRPAVAALLAFDALIERSVRTAREPVLGQIKLAWWRDELRAKSSAALNQSPGLDLIWGGDAAGALPLIEIVDGWEQLLAAPPLSADDLLNFAQQRGQGVFGAIGWLLEAPIDPGLGEKWALDDLAQRALDSQTAMLCRQLASDRRSPTSRTPRALRVLLATASEHETRMARARALLRATLG